MPTVSAQKKGLSKKFAPSLKTLGKPTAPKPLPGPPPIKLKRKSFSGTTYTILNDNVGCILSGEMVKKGFVPGKPVTSSLNQNTFPVVALKKFTPSTTVKKQTKIKWPDLEVYEYLDFLEQELLS